MKMELTECSETSAHKIQTPGNYPKERIQHSEHGESFEIKIKFIWHSQQLYSNATLLSGQGLSCSISQRNLFQHIYFVLLSALCNGDNSTEDEIHLEIKHVMQTNLSSKVD